MFKILIQQNILWTMTFLGKLSNMLVVAGGERVKVFITEGTALLSWHCARQNVQVIIHTICVITFRVTTLWFYMFNVTHYDCVHIQYIHACRDKGFDPPSSQKLNVLMYSVLWKYSYPFIFFHVLCCCLMLNCFKWLFFNISLYYIIFICHIHNYIESI